MESNEPTAYWTKYVFTFVIALLSFNSYTSAQDVDLSLTSNYTSLPQLESESIRNSNKLFLSLTLNDFSVKQYDVRLRLSIESNGVTMSTSNITNFKRFTLIPGIPIVITSGDLADYFDISTLDFAGIDKTQFLEQGILPEGNYKLCFTAIDAQADGVNPLSNKDCDLLPLKYTENPIIRSKASEAINTQILNWDSNTKEGDEVDYELAIFEFKGGAVDDAPIYQLPIFTFSVNSDKIDIKPVLKKLNSEILYTFFIKGQSKLGFDHFIKNNGYSKGLLFQNLQKSVDCDEVGEIVFEEIEGPNGSKLLHAYVDGCEPVSGGIITQSGYVSTVQYTENSGWKAEFYCKNPDGGPDCQISSTYGDTDCIVGSACITETGCSGTIAINEDTSTGGLIDYSEWTIGSNSIGDFNINGSANENHRILERDPWGNETVVWEARPEAASGPDGGWNTKKIDIDNTKTYRMSVWVNRKVRGTNGRFYFGTRGYGSINGVKSISNDAITTNPYFYYSSANVLGEEDEWILLVAHIYPNSHTGTTLSPESGKYTVKSGRIGGIQREYKWLPQTTQAQHRSYLYYCSDTNVRQQWAYPRFDVMDGTEPSLDDLLYGINCHCEEECESVLIDKVVNQQGQVFLRPKLPSDCSEVAFGTTDSGSILWSNGEKELNIEAKPGVSYSFEAICEDGCCYHGTFDGGSDCLIGAWCDDEDPCTINDIVSSNCQCIGEPIDECDNIDPLSISICAGDISIVVTEDPQGGSFLTADLSGVSCAPVEYIWNEDDANDQAYYSTNEEGTVSLMLLCASGCSYSAEIYVGECESESEVIFEFIEGPNGSKLLHAYLEGCNPIYGGIETGSGYASTVPFSESVGYEAVFYCVNPNGGPFCEIYGTYGNVDCIVGTACTTVSGCPGTLSMNEDDSTGGLIDYSEWTVGSNSIGGFSGNGSANENYRTLGRDPWGNETVIWEARPEAASGPDGGWNSKRIDIDNTKTYRMSVWVNRKVRGVNGNFYFGTRGYGSIGGIKDIANNAKSTNPYFYYSTAKNLGEEDEWILLVGHIYPNSHTGTTLSPESGKYTIRNGKIGEILREYKWLPQTTQALHRSYLYYCTDTEVRQQWVYPRFDVMDGTEPSLDDLLYGPSCNCEEECTAIQIREVIDPQGQVTLHPVLPEDCNGGTLGIEGAGSFLWSNGETNLSILAVPGANYSFEATCSDGCCYQGTYGSGDCWPGTWCDDGDPCTINDLVNDACICRGEAIETCDPNDPTSGCEGELSINATTDPQGGSFMVADLSDIDCIVEAYIWNENPANNQAYFYSATEGVVTLRVLCTSGCSYSAEQFITGVDVDPELLCPEIIVTELEDCLFEISYPDIIEPACNMALGPNIITHSLCGNETGRIVVNPEDGNEPYHFSWSTGDSGYENELNHLLAGNYDVTITDLTGCAVTTSATILDKNSVGFSTNGGDGGLIETLTLPPGMALIWKFNPATYTDQFILNGQVDTKRITNGTELACANNYTCICSDVFMGDYDDGAVLPITGGAIKLGEYAVGDFNVPNSGIINLFIDGSSCPNVNGTYWELILECQPEPIIGSNEEDLNYVMYPDEVFEMIKAGFLTKKQFQEDSIAYYATAHFEKVVIKDKSKEKLDSRSVGNSTTILDFRCSGFEISPYTISMYNTETEEYFECDIIDLIDCPECDEDNPCNATLNINVEPATSIDNIILTAVSSCEAVNSYLWSNGSIASSITVPMDTDSYSVTITCGECNYIALYDNDVCIDGVPCDDGEACTDEDVYNEDCDCIGVQQYDLDGTPLTDCDEDPCTATLNVKAVPSSSEVNNIVITAVSSCDDVDSYIWSNGSTQSSITVPMLLETYSVTVTCGDCEYETIYLNDICISTVLCDDDNNCTILDAYNANCECVGIPIDDLSCTDNNPCTINDTYDENCNCIGTQLYEEDETTPLTDCEETNPCDAEVSIDVIPTENYNQVLLSAVSSCDASSTGNVTTYEWSNGSDQSTILVSTQSGEYTVTITCGDCKYLVIYNTSGCLVGLPCNDGLDCTENDEVQENCECHGTNIEDANFIFSENIVYKQSCDYDACLPSFAVYSKFVITSVDVILEDGSPFQLNKGLNSQGFDFPYCISDGSVSCEGLPSPSALASDIAAWLGGESEVFLGTPDDFQSACFISKAIYVKNSTIEFVAINGYNNFIEELSFPYTSYGCDDGMTPIGINITATIDCDTEVLDEEGNVIDIILPTYIWSDGTQSSTAYIPYGADGELAYCLEVSATCMNGCTYTSNYGENCEICTFGSPCAEDEECTINFTYDEECICIGQPLSDSDGDGICDADDDCPLGDDNIDLDDDGIPDACDTDVDCGELLTASIDVVTSNESCTYCLLLNDPIFTDPEVTLDIYLHSISIIDNGQPKLLNAASNSMDGFHFPYEIDTESDVLLLEQFLKDLNAYLGDTGNFELYPGAGSGDGQCLDVTTYTIETTQGPLVVTIPEVSIGPSFHGNIDLPTIFQSLQFVWGGNNIVNKYFYNPDPCEDLAHPFTLEASLAEECGGEPTYEWSTGATTSSIQVSSLAGMYSVTITCGVCSAEAETTNEEGEEGCLVGDGCNAIDECDNPYSGFFDAYCQCINDNPQEYLDADGDGILDCICPSGLSQVSETGEILCCDDPPALIYDDEPVTKTVYNYCTDFKDNETIYAIGVNGSHINSEMNYDQGNGDDDGNFFHFPYCIEDNCNNYGEGIYIPYNQKNLNRLAYDLQKWASFNGHPITFSTNYDDASCDKCGQDGNLLFVNGNNYPHTINIYTQIEGTKEMEICKTQVFDGYYVRFAPYDGDCTVTSVTVATQGYDTEFKLEGLWGINLNSNSMKFGPVPHKGIGFKATVKCEGGCIYEVTNEDVDCIVGEPCDSPIICATETYSSYDNEDCACLVIKSNDRDEDGVCDDDDICPVNLPAEQGYNVLYDDNLDADNDGIPNGCDDECGSQFCFVEVSYGSSSCPLNFNEAYMKLTKNGVAINLALESGFHFPYVGGEGTSFSTFEDFKQDLAYWLNQNDVPFDFIYLDNATLKITGTTIFGIQIVNNCDDKYNGKQKCLDPICDFSIKTRVDRLRCPMILDITVLKNGIEVSLASLLPSDVKIFPICIEGYEPALTSNKGESSKRSSCEIDCIALEKVQDIFTTYNLGTLEIEFSDPDYVTITISNSNLEFILAHISQGVDIPSIRIKFEDDNCTNRCDDGWICTTDDHYDENCNCVGVFQDSDNDNVCDPLDQCADYPDYLDSDNDGIPDCNETEISMDCAPEDIPYCKFLEQLLKDTPCHQGTNPKIMFNNLIAINDYLKVKLANNDAMLQYLPFPILKKQLEKQGVNDADEDGIVNILDPAPDEEAYKEGEGQLSGTHNFNDDDFVTNSLALCEWNPEEGYARERAQLLNMFLYTVNPGVLVGSNEDDSNNPITSGCFYDLQSVHGFVASDYNEAGYFYSNLTKCYVYFELDCSCNCIVKETQAINLIDERCEDGVTIGDECTTDPVLENTDGYHYVKCPPEGADPCAIFGIVSNPDYDPYDPGDEVPCSCEQQMLPNGEPSETIDSDGDGYCDIIDQCWPARDDEGNLILDEFDENGNPNDGYIPYQETDSDGDGIMDCWDLCDGVVDPIFTKEGYAAPSGPGDVCDDGESCTYDDVITEDCECRGVYIDSDDDGVYDCEECEYEFVKTDQVPVIVDGEPLVEDGVAVTVPKDIYNWGATSIEVDAVGNLVDADTPPGEIRTLIGCDVCPGIPDGDPLDQDEFPMDYNNNGIPDCIDPPFKPICPDDWKIVEGVGLVLIFNTDNLSEGDYPEPINFQGKVNDGFFVNWEYLIIDSSRELEDGTTEVIYIYEQGEVQSYDWDIANIIYSDHQQCRLTDDEVVPLSCPTDIFVSQQSGIKRLSFDLPESGYFDLNDMFGTYIINGVEIELAGFYEDGGAVDVLLPDEIDLQDPFNGTIILPSGQECVYEDGIQESCVYTVSEDNTITVNPGEPCDDGNICTHHDKYITSSEGICECIGEDKPDADSDGFCDAIDPCPEDYNQPTADITGDNMIDHLDIMDCPCPSLELDNTQTENPILENVNDFYLHLNGDLSGFTDITVMIDNGQNNSGQEESISPSSPLIIPNLVGGYTYTITITAYCANGEPQILTYTVDVPFGDSPIVCGVELDPEDLASFSLLPSLQKGEEFVAADFIVNVREVEGSYGKFSGNGYISVPYFNAARLNITFENILISDERDMIDGFIEINGFGLAILGDDISDAINDGLDDIINVLTDLNDVLETIIPVLEGIEDLIETMGEFVDQDIKDCLILQSSIIEELILQAEDPSIDEATKAQIKLDIEAASLILQGCQEQFDQALEEILGEVLTYFNNGLTHWKAVCENSNIAIEYSDAVTAVNADHSAIIVDTYIPNEYLIGEFLIEDLISEETQIITKRYGAVNDGNPQTVPEVYTTYYNKQKENAFCNYIINAHNIIESGTTGFNSVQMKTVLVELLDIGVDFSTDMKNDIINNVQLTEAQKLEQSNEILKTSITNYIMNKYYGE